ncbi:hypothetical protein Golomagni_06844 [Golovinomyces magnicellulatus]|nr:hypothetical protein Golomagni_06844 [Golovinomyces magnicellulatus]
MKFFAVLAIAGAAVAAPAQQAAAAADYMACTGLQSQAQCCGPNVLNVADLDCKTPEKAPKSAKDFQSLCAKSGKQPMCCTLPLLGQGLLCNPPVGI